MSKKVHTVALELMIEKHIGEKGSLKRDRFENELKLDLLGIAVKNARQQQNLTQEQLGEMVGVQKAQISKIENSVKNARLETILKVFDALGVTVKFYVEMKVDAIL